MPATLELCRKRSIARAASILLATRGMYYRGEILFRTTKDENPTQATYLKNT